MILPERVFGRPGANWILSGVASGPIAGTIVKPNVGLSAERTAELVDDPAPAPPPAEAPERPTDEPDEEPDEAAAPELEVLDGDERGPLAPAVASLSSPYVVALIDVDGFGAINTCLGLAGGDAILLQLATLLTDSRARTPS